MPTFTTYREASKDEMGREIDRCHKVIADLEARLARVPDREAVARAISKPFAEEADGCFSDGDLCDDTADDTTCGCRRLCHAAADAAIAAMQETKP